MDDILRATATHRVTLFDDCDCPSPREEDTLGLIWTWGERDPEGDDTAETRELDAWLARRSEWPAPETIARYIARRYGATAVLPCYVIEHSGTWVTTGGNLLDGATVNWRREGLPSGLIFDTETTRKMTGAPVDTIARQLEDEAEEWGKWLNGDTYGWLIEELVTTVTTATYPDGSVIADETGSEWRTVDACGGYVGLENVEDAARGEFARFEDGTNAPCPRCAGPGTTINGEPCKPCQLEANARTCAGTVRHYLELAGKACTAHEEARNRAEAARVEEHIAEMTARATELRAELAAA